MKEDGKNRADGRLRNCMCKFLSVYVRGYTVRMGSCRGSDPHRDRMVFQRGMMWGFSSILYAIMNIEKERKVSSMSYFDDWFEGEMFLDIDELSYGDPIPDPMGDDTENDSSFEEFYFENIDQYWFDTDPHIRHYFEE